MKKNMKEERKILVGIKPSGNITLGNYLGVLKPLQKLIKQDNCKIILFIADLHSLTIPQKVIDLRNNILNLLKILISSNLYNKKVTIFKQSDISGCTELQWLLTCNTNLSEFTKMPQYKNYIEKNGDMKIPSGMLMYPSLMSADCLLYNCDEVLVGEDQFSHIYLTRDIVDTFNKRYKTNFRCPRILTITTSSKIMSLSNPHKKMSKSESDKGTIYLLEDLNVVRSKIMKSITDNENIVRYDPVKKPGISNLINIYSSLTNLSFNEIQQKYENLDYKVFKEDLSNLVCKELYIIQQNYSKLNNLKSINLFLNKLLNKGKKKMNKISKSCIDNVYKKVGLR